MTRRRKPASPRIHPLVREFFSLRERDPRTNKTLCGEAGMSTNTLTTWLSASNPSIPYFEAMLNVLGFELRIEPMLRK